MLLTWASSFGQTFFISIYAGDLRAEFGLSHGDWGAIYTAGTVASAAVLMQVGKAADALTVRRLALMVLAGYVAVCLAMAAVQSWWMLILVVAGLRFCGQGMMSHLALTAMARWFRARRGQATAVASIGFSVGEASMPVIFVALSGAIGWRQGWVVAAAVLAVFVAPALLVLLRRERTPQSHAAVDDSTGLGGRHWTRREALRHWLFWALTPGLLAPPFISTAVFFQQVHLAEIKGWAHVELVALFPLYSLTTLMAMFGAGWAADRFGSARLLPAYLLPLAAGLVVLAVAGDLAGAGLALCAMGLTQGGAQALIGTVWAEYFGTRHIGAIRAAAVSSMVFATALGPGVTGVLIDRGVGFETQLGWMAGYLALVSALFVGVARRAAAELAGPAAAV